MAPEKSNLRQDLQFADGEFTPAPESRNGTDELPEDYPQLSMDRRVSSDVSSLALDSGMLRSSSSAVVAASQAGDIPPSVALQDDAQVMVRVAAGDDSAFDYLVQKYRRPIISFMYRMTHNAATAEELAQEVFLRVYRSRASYSPDAKFTTWLYRIATNLSVNHARDTKYERPENQVSIDEPDEDTGLTVDVVDGSLNAEQNILRRERLAAIKQHVTALPERQRLAVMMHKYQGMDYRQIAEVLKLSESATKSLLFRAYETLREKLKSFV